MHIFWNQRKTSGHTEHIQNYGCATITTPATNHPLPFQRRTLTHHPACLRTLNRCKSHSFSWGSWIWGLFPPSMLLLLCATLHPDSWHHSYPVSPPTAASLLPFSIWARQQQAILPFPNSHLWTTSQFYISMATRWSKDRHAMAILDATSLCPARLQAFFLKTLLYLLH